MDRALWRLASVVVLGTIMSILDTTIVNVAIETLGRDLDASLSSIQWVSTGYLLALATVIPLTGWAMERFGGRNLWMLSVALFLVGSVLCGLAWSTSSLIAFRVLQGFGGGMIMPVGQAILAQAAGPERMGRIMSVIGVPTLLGPILGPVIGGLIVDNFSWRWIFFVNVPVGLVALTLAWRILPRAESIRRGAVLDIRGLLLLSPGLAFLVYGLSQVGMQGSFTDYHVLIGVGLGVVLLVGFAFHAVAAREKSLIDLSLFRDRAFAAASGTTFIFGVSLFGAMLILPLYYQVVRGESALNAGLLLAPQGIGAAMAMPIAGRLTDRLGAGKIVPPGVHRRVDRHRRVHPTRGRHELRGPRRGAVGARHRAGHDDDAVDGRGVPDALARGGPPRDLDDQHHPHRRRVAGHGRADRRAGAPDRGQRAGRDRRPRLTEQRQRGGGRGAAVDGLRPDLLGRAGVDRLGPDPGGVPSPAPAAEGAHPRGVVT